MTTIAVIAKEPRPGLSKTRLTPPCTPAQAARLAEASLTQTLGVVQEVAAERKVLFLEGEVGAWCPDAFEVLPQIGGGLDERIADAFSRVTGPVLLIGMDTPQVTPSCLRRAFLQLRTTDAVLGPALDGGWWALGMAEPMPEVILGVPMSTPHTFEVQFRRLVGAGMRTGRLEPMRDMDRFVDAIEIAARCPGTPFASAVRAVASGSEVVAT